ncbi:serine hydrolase domain-containing protein [Reichenbachiella sp.]|uniref:serine hydrolase domain-containing protein n=1 Tax=Reichenbachiella sp. TaxID=2184521 RepID=UPI003299680A
MTQKTKHLLLKTLLIGLLIQTGFSSVSLGQSKEEKIDQAVSLYADYGKFNGSILVSENGKVIYKKGFGKANMEWNIPNQPNTKHRIGSITKQFTAMLVLQQVQQGNLSLDDVITDHLSNYPKATGDKITLHHLLTHTSGIPNYTSYADFFKNETRNPYQPEEFIKLFSDSALHFTPGKKFEYSNSGYFLLGAILEKVTGKPYELVLQENILTPLGMTNTGFDHYATILKNRAAGYEKEGSGYKNADYIDMSIPYAAGSMYSTVEDLYLWDQALYTEQLLSSKYKELLFTPFIPAWSSSYGYGWFIMQLPIGGENDPLLIHQHDGGVNGFHTVISRIPSEKHMIVMLNNTGHAALNDINLAINAILHDLPYQLPKRSFAKTLWEVASTKGFEAGLQWFNENRNSTDYELNEYEINVMGYQLLNMQKTKEAIIVFQLNVDAFPESWNTYDSLAEAYIQDGNEEMAVVYYKKSLKLNSKNTNAKKYIKAHKS